MQILSHDDYGCYREFEPEPIQPASILRSNQLDYYDTYLLKEWSEVL